MSDDETTSSDHDRELAAQYGDTLRAMPEGPAKELAIREYWLSVALNYGDDERVAELGQEIAALRQEHPELP